MNTENKGQETKSPLRIYREEVLNMSLYELGTEIGVNAATLSAIERGVSQEPRPRTRRMILQGLSRLLKKEVDPKEIFPHRNFSYAASF